MTKVIQCPCGYSMRDEDEEGLIRSAQTHAMSAHGVELTREQAMAMAKPEPVGRRPIYRKDPEV
jgi:predicted small metal-binding protein